MAKFIWQDGTLVSKAKVEVGGTIYEVDPEEYSGATPLSANNLNAMQDGIYEDINSVVESGSNENGQYIKFADGTMICCGRKIESTTTWTQWGYAINWDATNPVTFPQSFLNVYYCNAMACGGYAAGVIRCRFDNNGIFGITFSRADGLRDADIEYSWIAIGRWK